MTIDAHLHVWDTRKLSYPWLETLPELNRPYLPEHTRSNSVDGVVFVQADATDGVAEAEWVQSLDWPQLRGIVAHAPIEHASALGQALDGLQLLPSLVGIRRLLQDEQAGFIESEPVVAGLRHVRDRGLPFDACIRHWQLDELVRAVKKAEGLTVVLDHLGKPPIAAGWGGPEAEDWYSSLRELAKLPGTRAKLSGLAPEARESGNLREQVAPFVDVALELFGPDRLMIGSDFPVSAATGHGLKYDEWFELLDALLGFSERERSQVFGGTATRTYGL